MGSRKDPAWKYAVEVEVIENKGTTQLRCCFCSKLLKGGVYRFKEHLAGIQGNVSPCPSVLLEVREEMCNILMKFHKGKKMSQLIREERIDKCVTMNNSSKLGSNSATLSQRRLSGPMDRFLRIAEEGDDVVETDEQGGPTTETTRSARDQTCQDIGRFFFENGLAFNIANSPSFVNMCRSIGRYGTGFRPPTAHELRTSILKKEEESTDAIVANVKMTWVQTGVSILSDGWKDMRGRQLINILVNNPHGTVFLRSIDVSDAVKDASMLFKLLDDVVEEVGEDNVVQVVTDNASNYKKAGEMLMEKRKRLWWTPCAAHCINLMLEKLGELPQHKNALIKARKVSFNFHIHLLPYYFNRNNHMLINTLYSLFIG